MRAWLVVWLLVQLACSGSVKAQAADPATTATQAATPAEPVTEAGSPTERARAHFKLGVDFYRERNFRAALIEFKRAYNAAPHYKLLYNLGQASLELQEDASAIGYFSDYLRQGKDELTPERRQEVEDTIHRLEGRIATVSISTNQWGAEIYVDDTLIGRAPLDEPIRVSVGRRKLTAVKEGFQNAERIQDIAAGDHLSVRLDFEEKPAKVEPVIAYREPLYADAAPSHPVPPALWTGVATGVLGVGAVTMTILTALAQKDYNDQRQVETTKQKLDSLRDDAKQKALITDIAWSATLVMGVVTTVLIVTHAGSDAASAKSASAPSIQVGVGPFALTVQGTL